MPNTDDQPDWLQLLSSLTDDELHRYGEIAADQQRLEWKHGWAQVACMIAALAALGWFIREFAMSGLTWRTGAVFGLALALGYWPYRKAIVRRLWAKHRSAVKLEETVRRKVEKKD